MKSVYVSFLMSAELEAVQYLFPFKGPLTEQPFMELFFAFILAAGCSAIFSIWEHPAEEQILLL